MLKRFFNITSSKLCLALNEIAIARLEISVFALIEFDIVL